jgi:adenylosuccinate lyase
VLRFGEADAQAIKDIEKTTNHDVKAVEYWLKSRVSKASRAGSAGEFVHFACTSEDINNTSHALMLKAARDRCCCRRWTACWPISCRRWRMLTPRCPCSAARTARRPAPPRWARRWPTWRRGCAGARAHRRGAAAGQDERRGGQLQRPPVGLSGLRLGGLQPPVVEGQLGLAFNPYTIQIEPHDCMAELFDAVARANTILIDWCRDVWGYISLGYFKQKTRRPARSARRPCRTRSTRSTSRTPRATSAWPMRC